MNINPQTTVKSNLLKRRYLPMSLIAVLGFCTIVGFQNFTVLNKTATSTTPSLIPLDLTMEAGYTWGPTFLDRQDTKYAGTQYVVTPQLRAPYQTGSKDFSFTIDYATQYSATFALDSQNNRFLNLQLTSNLQPEQNYKDKVELNVTRTNDPMYVLDFTSQTTKLVRRYLAFDFKLDQNYQVPYQWALHMQAFQPCGYEPPFAIYVEPRAPSGDPLGPVNLVFVARDNDSLAGSIPTGTTIYRGGYEIYRLNNVTRNQWHNMVFQLQPMHNADPGSATTTTSGQIALWLDGAAAPAFVWRHDWGYAPSSTSSCAGKALEAKMNLKLGIYRRRHNTTQIIGFDNIRYGGTKESVTAP